MRLTLFEIEKIIILKNKYFNESSSIYLFGSRTDDTQKGGDIDLFIIPSKDINEIYSKKEKFIVELQNKLGEQKIDLIISKDKTRPIEIEALKGIELNLNKIKLNKYFNECDEHLQRIEEAYDDIKNTLPLTVNKYQNLTKDEVQDIDQYLYRFSKLQDTLGQKIFKLILDIYEPSSEVLPFLDIINKLEKLNFLDNKKEWINLRAKRNNIAHQYDDDPFEMTDAINNILNQKKILKSIYLKIKEKSKSILDD